MPVTVTGPIDCQAERIIRITFGVDAQKRLLAVCINGHNFAMTQQDAQAVVNGLETLLEFFKDGGN
jgi:hypothetical protein